MYYAHFLCFTFHMCRFLLYDQSLNLRIAKIWKLNKKSLLYYSILLNVGRLRNKIQDRTRYKDTETKVLFQYTQIKYCINSFNAIYMQLEYIYSKIFCFCSVSYKYNQKHITYSN